MRTVQPLYDTSWPDPLERTQVKHSQEYRPFFQKISMGDYVEVARFAFPRVPPLDHLFSLNV